MRGIKVWGAIVAVAGAGACAAACGSFDGSEEAPPPEETTPAAEVDAGGPDAKPDVLAGEPADYTFSITAPEKAATLVQGGSVKIAVTVARGAQVDDAIELTVTAPPTGITVAKVTLAPGESAAELEVKASDDAAQGPMEIEVHGATVTLAGAAEATAKAPLFVRGAAGALDTTFGDAATPGRATLFSGSTPEPVEILVTSKDEIVVVGHCTSPSEATCVARLDAKGALDKSFGSQGIAFLTQITSPSTATLQPDDKILVGAGKEVWRLTAKGGHDPAFGNGSGVYLSSAPTAITQILVASTGRVAVGVNTSVGCGVAMLESSGAVAGDFGLSGFSNMDWGGTCNGFVFRSSGQIAATGLKGADYGILQIDGTTGAYDTMFAPPDGRATWSGPYVRETRHNGVQLADGRIITGYSGNGHANLISFLPDGTGVDPTFGPGGIFGGGVRYFEEQSDTVGDLIGAPDGKLLFVFPQPGGNRLVRLLANGDFDTAFGDDGHVIASINQNRKNDVVRLGQQKDGHILVLSYNEPPGGVGSLVVSRYWP